MSNKTSQEKIKAFVERWTGKGYEKGESQVFWIELLTDVLGVETPSEIISFEDQVKLDHTSFIDAYIKTTHVMIEQKSIDKDLKAPIKQSDGTLLTPFQQAKRYASELPYSKRPRWIVTCNFKSFLIYDMEQPQGEPFEILLENLPKEAHILWADYTMSSYSNIRERPPKPTSMLSTCSACVSCSVSMPRMQEYLPKTSL